MPPAAKQGASRRGRVQLDSYRKKVNSLLPDQTKAHIYLIVVAAIHTLLSILLAATKDAVGGADSSIDQHRSRFSLQAERRIEIALVVFSCLALIAVVLMVWRYRSVRAECLTDYGRSHPLPTWMNHRDFRPSEALHKPDGQKRRRRTDEDEPSKVQNEDGQEKSRNNDVDEFSDEDDPVDPLYASVTVPFEERTVLWVTFNMFPGTGPNIADVFYIICLALMAAILTFPNNYTTPIAALGCLCCLLFLIRPVVTSQAMLPTRPLPLGVTPMASSMDKTITPATTYISATAFVDIDRFLATADVRQRTFGRAGLTIGQMTLGSFISIAVVMVVIGIVAFVVLQLQFIGSRAPFYPDSRLRDMSDINHVANYWPQEDTTTQRAMFETMEAKLDEVDAAAGHSISHSRNPASVQAALAALGLASASSSSFSTLALGSLFHPAGKTAREVLQDLSAAAKVPRLKRVSNKRVLLVVLDGMRWDFLDRNSGFRALLRESWLRRDAKVLKMKGQLPSMSVPNWLTLVSGAPPEITGLLGNIGTSETKFDTIFSRAGLFDPPLDIDSFNSTAASMLTTAPFQRGLTGSPWFGDLLRNHLPELQGIGTVDVGYLPPHVEQKDVSGGFFADHDTVTADYADWRRATIAVQAMAQTQTPYQLFLAHFSDIDQQGHCCGVERKYNKRNTYDGAVGNKTVIIRAMLDAVRTHPLAKDTVVLITSDHGHLAPGGHGGVSSVLTDLPLIIYAPGSDLGFTPGATPDGSRFPTLPNGKMVDNNYEQQTQEIPSTYVAPTITALLGIPAPRQSTGLIVNEALSLLPPSSVVPVTRDLFEQKKQLLNAFMAQSGAQADHRIYSDPVLADDYNPLQTAQGYIDGAARVSTLYEQHRSETQDMSLLRNFFIALVTVFCLAFIGIISLENRSVVFMRSLVVYRYNVLCCIYNKKAEREENESTKRYSTKPVGQLSDNERITALGTVRVETIKHNYSGAAKKRRETGADLSEFEYRQTANLLESKPITGEKNVNDCSMTGQDITRRRSSVLRSRSAPPGASRNNAPGFSTNGQSETRGRAGSISVSRPSVNRPSVSYGVVPNRTFPAQEISRNGIARGSVMMMPLGTSSSGISGRNGGGPPSPTSGSRPSVSQSFKVNLAPNSNGRSSSGAGPGFGARSSMVRGPNAGGPLAPPPVPYNPSAPAADVDDDDGAYTNARGRQRVEQRAFDYDGADLGSYENRDVPGGVSTAGENNVLPTDRAPAEEKVGYIEARAVGSSTVLGVRTVRKRRIKKPVAKLSVVGDGEQPPHWAETAGVGNLAIQPQPEVKQTTEVNVRIIDDDDGKTDLHIAVPEPEQEPEQEEGLAMPTKISTYDPAARDWKRYHDEFKEMALLNRRAIVVAVCFVVVYIALSVGIFAATYRGLGYSDTLDSSVLHTDLVLPRYLFLAVLVPCIIQLILLRGLHAPFIIYTPAPQFPAETKLDRAKEVVARYWSNFWRLMLTEFTSYRGLINPTSRGFLYLTCLYLLVILVCVLLVLMIAQACFEFWIPTLYPVYFITDSFWVTRFRVLAFELMLMPFIIFTSLMILCLPPFHPYDNHYDSILRLFIYKERALMLRQEPVPLNLDAALEVIDRELDLIEDMRMTGVKSAREAARINKAPDTN